MKRNSINIKQWLRTAVAATLLLTVGLPFTACTKDAVGPAADVTAPGKELLVKSEKVATVPASVLQLLAGGLGNQLKNEVKYDVNVFRINYLTTYQGKEIEASGLVALPVKRETPAPVVSVQHGTIFKHEEAPSASKNGVSGFEVLASAGYVTVVPDFIGFGASKNVLHPYYNQQYSGLAVVDMIKAAKSLYRQENIKITDQLFLVGYSEGGYVTMAAQKEIETNPAHGLKVTAAGAGAGGYDLVDMMSGVVSGKPYTYPAYLAYVVMGYNEAYGWNRPMTDFFKEPYASRVKNLFNGQHSGSAINAQLTTNPEALFSVAFLEGLRGEGEQQFKQALQENSFNNWVPQSLTRLYHGTADDIVPFANSEETYNRMKAGGAPALSFLPIKGGNHGSSFLPMLSDLVPWIRTVEKP